MVDGFYGKKGVGKRRNQECMVKLHLTFHMANDGAKPNSSFSNSVNGQFVHKVDRSRGGVRVIGDEVIGDQGHVMGTTRVNNPRVASWHFLGGQISRWVSF